MARGRIIDRRLWRSTRIQSLLWNGGYEKDGPAALLTYIALVMASDSAGCAEWGGEDILDEMAKVGRTLFDSTLTDWTEDGVVKLLEDVGLIETRIVGGQRYARVLQFEEYNKIRLRDDKGRGEPPSELARIFDKSPGNPREPQVRSGMSPITPPLEVEVEVEVEGEVEVEAASLPADAPLTETGNRIAAKVARFWTVPEIDSRVYELALKLQSLTNGSEALDDRLSWARGNLGKIRNRVAWLESVVPARAAEITCNAADADLAARVAARGGPIDPAHVEVNAAEARDGWVRGAASGGTEKAGDIAARIVPMRKDAE